MAALDAHNLAIAFLDAVLDALDTIPAEDATLLGAPAHYYVATGTPAIDCEQAVAWIENVHEESLSPTNENEMAAGTRGRMGRVNFVQMRVMVARCIPEGTPPAAVALQAASKQTDADIWAMWCGLNEARRTGRVGDLCDSVTFGVATTLTTSGGFGGWQVPLAAQLQGYRPEIGS